MGESSRGRCVRRAPGPKEMKEDPCAKEVEPLGGPGKRMERTESKRAGLPKYSPIGRNSLNRGKEEISARRMP